MALVPALAVWLAGAPLAAGDCNGNGADDRDEIAAGTAADCNRNDLPDECEAMPSHWGRRALEVLPGTPLAAVVTDLDGDGMRDLAAGTGEPGEPGLSVLLRDGDGPYTLRTLPSPAPVAALAAGDADGDGVPDLAFLREGALWFLPGPGDGDLGDPVLLGSGSLTAVAAGDLDGDGLADLTATGGGAISVLLAAGGGAFTAPRDLPLPGAGLLALADLDGDGDLEIAAAAAAGVLALLENDGRGAFSEPRMLDGLDPLEGAPLAADLDGDGLADLALRSASSITVVAGDGAGSFTVTSTYTPEGAVPSVLAAGDLDGDGDQHLVLGRSRPGGPAELQALRNRGGGRFDTSLSLALEWDPAAAVVADLDLDGNQDLVLLARDAPLIAILTSSGGGDPLPLSPALREERLAVEAESFEPHATFLEDTDLDGDLDLVTMDGEYRVLVLANQGDGTLAEGVVYELRDADELIWITPFDLEGDGFPDVACVDERTDYLLLLGNQGDGTFSQTPESYRSGDQPSFLAAADFDGDGREDLLGANEGSGTVRLFLNAGDGTVSRQEALAVGQRPVGLAAGDFDGDGDMDAAVAKAGSAKIAVLRNLGGGTLGERVDHDVGRPRYVLALDADGDGDLDLTAAHEGGESLPLLLNDGEGAFALRDILPVGRPPYSVIAADLDRDGTKDLVAASETADTVSVLLARGGGLFALPLHYRVGRDSRFVAAGDLDGDGDEDLVAANHSSFDFSLLHNELPVRLDRSYLEGICTELDLFTVSVPAGEDSVLAGGEGPVRRRSAYLVPAASGAPGLLPALFANSRRHPDLRRFLAEVFPERFAGLSEEEYLLLVARRATRSYFTGALYRLAPEGRALYGFSVATDAAADPAELPAVEEVRGVRETLLSVLALEPLAYFPDTRAAREDAETWGDPGFPVLVYTPPPRFLRGDADGGGVVDLTDAVVLLGRLFRGSGPIACLKAADANDDGRADVSDAVAILLHLFAGRGPLREPFAGCGVDPTPDALSCDSHPPCDQE